MDPAVFGYIRVSQAEGASGLDTQSRILTDHGLRDDRIFTDVASGRNMRRPAGRPPGTRGCHDDPSRGPRPVRRRRQRHGSGCGQRHIAQHTLRSYRLHWSKSQDWTKARGFPGTAGTPPGPGLLPRRPGRSRGQPVGRQAGDALGPTGPWRTSCARRPTWCTLSWSIRQPGNDEIPRGAARVGYLGQGFPQSQCNLYLPVLPSPDLRIPKNNLIVDPRLTTVQQLMTLLPHPPPAVLTPSIGVLQWIRGKVGCPSNNSHT